MIYYGFREANIELKISSIIKMIFTVCLMSVVADEWWIDHQLII